jgi:carboxyl-terminal processing protease
MKKLISHPTVKTSLVAAGLLIVALAPLPGADAIGLPVALRPSAASPGSYGGDVASEFNLQSQSPGGWTDPANAASGTWYCPTCRQPAMTSFPWGSSTPASSTSRYSGDFLPPGYGAGGFPLNGQTNPSSQPRDRYQSPSGTSLPGVWCPTGTCPTGVCPTGTCPIPTSGGSTAPISPYPTGNVWPNVPSQPATPAVPRQVDDGTDIQGKITARYQNADMLAFLNRMSMNQATNLYVEASRLIDTRHVSPTSYEVRTKRALEGLLAAVQNPSFLQASRANPNPQQVQALQRELEQLARTNPARTAHEALGLMQWAADLANRRIGVRKEAVALEFLHSTLDSLDRYSSFSPSKAAYGMLDAGQEWKSAVLEENIVGVGVELKAHDRGALVLSVVENGPAARARLAAGDLIVGVDGRSVQGMSLSQIANLIGGPAGSTVTFRLLRNGQEFTASMRRESVYVSSVAGAQMLDSETGYIRLKQFSQSSAEDLERAMWSLFRGGRKSLVLDLRGNPGGLLTEAVEVSNLFVPAGRIVATKGRTAADDSDERATWEKTWRIPLVVLVDEDSASASEIFAAAIQENGRGVIVGRNTHGKGTVQTHFPLQSVSGNLKLTTAKFYSPRGREIAGAGVRPDVTVAGKTEDFLTAGLTGDQDVRTAREVIARGTPAALAAMAGQTGVRQDLSLSGN